MDRYEFYSNLQTYQKNSLEHYGILGQKWGKRRWQNSDGTFNAEGKERYFGSKGKKSESDDDKQNKKIGHFHFFEPGYKKGIEYAGDYDRDEVMKRDFNKEIDKLEPRFNELHDDYYQRLSKPQELWDELSLVSEEMKRLNDLQRFGGNKKFEKNKEYQNFIKKTGIDFLDPDNTITKDLKTDYKMAKKYTNQLLVALDCYAHGKNKEGDNYLDRFIKNDKDKEIIKEMAKREGEKQAIKIETRLKNAKDLANKVKTTKNLKGENISDEEFEKIRNDTKSSSEIEKENKEDYNNTADIGIITLSKNKSHHYTGDPGDDGERMWFMYEDQTIGLPQLTYLYYKGYSKAYIKNYINKIEKMSLDYDDDDYDGNIWSIKFAAEEGYADDFVDDLFKK